MTRRIATVSLVLLVGCATSGGTKDPFPGSAPAAPRNAAGSSAAPAAAEAEPDPMVLSACRREFEERAAGCAADGSAPLQDAEGRFGAAARPCYSSLSQVLARARTMAATTGACCRCLAGAGCARSGEACNRTLASGGGGPQACMARSCALECRAFLPDEPPDETPLPTEKGAAPAARSPELKKT